MEEDDAIGELLGCWRTELGQLGRVLLLRGFETAADLATERRRALLSVNLILPPQNVSLSKLL